MAMIATVALTGCATSRSVVDPSIAASANPAQGKAVRIEKVVDAQVFEKAPSEPSTPSLDPSEPTDDKIKARAIARKRNGYGKALGDVLLPENKTAAKVGGGIARQARQQLEHQTGQPVVTAGNYLPPQAPPPAPLPAKTRRSKKA